MRQEPEKARRRRGGTPARLRTILTVCAALWAVLALAPLGAIPAAMVAAHAAAAGRPYCIEVASPPDGQSYMPAARPLDLSGARMRAGRSERRDFLVFHAVLFVDNGEQTGNPPTPPRYDRFNWSYRHMRFMPIEGQGHVLLRPRPRCTPATDFAARLVFG